MDNVSGLPLRIALLQALLAAPSPAGVSLPRLAKQFGVRVSVLMRELAPLGDAHIGDVAGLGWVQLVQTDDARWSAHLTEAGRAALLELPHDK